MTRLENKIDKILSLFETQDLVSESEAAKLLGISVLTLRNKVYSKEMEGYYTIDATNGRQYKKSFILDKSKKILNERNY